MHFVSFAELRHCAGKILVQPCLESECQLVTS
jgi:hypothetical protein